MPPYSLGVSIINIGGKDNYSPFLSLAKDFDIPWFIFSDGEPEAIASVQAAVIAVFQQDYTLLNNIVVLTNGDDYEKHLIRAGYDDIMIEAICAHENDADFFSDYMQRMQGQKRKKEILRDYNHQNGRTEALTDLTHESKTEYALPIAQKLISQIDATQRIPHQIEQLFSELSNKIGVPRNSAEEVTE